MTDSSRRYSDAEMREILRLASSNERLPPDEQVTAGLTLPEIRAIADEVGIDPLRVDLAAQALAKPTVTNSVLGFGVTFQQEFSIPAVLTDTQLHAVADEADRTIGGIGEVRQNLHGIEWHNARRFAFVGIARTAAATRIRVITDHGYELLTSAGLTTILGRIAYSNASDVTSVPEVGVAIVVVGAAAGTFHIYWRWRAQRIAARIQRFSARLQGVISLTSSEGGVVRADPSKE